VTPCGFLPGPDVGAAPGLKLHSNKSTRIKRMKLIRRIGVDIRRQSTRPWATFMLLTELSRRVGTLCFELRG
jgi:hypothetical protein